MVYLPEWASTAHFACFAVCRVAALAQERIHSPDQQQYWLNLLLLMFAAADACDRALREKVCKVLGYMGAKQSQHYI